jgi:hypothetical protein
VTVVPGAVDAERFTPHADGAPVRLELAPATRRPSLRRTDGAEPGHDILLRAMARLRDRMPEVRLVLVGRGEGRPALESMVGELGLEKTVVFAGYRGADLPAVLAALDCFVLLGVGSEETAGPCSRPWPWPGPSWPPSSGRSPRSWSMERPGGWSRRPPTRSRPVWSRCSVTRERARQFGEAGRRRVEALYTPAAGARRSWKASTPGRSPKKRFPGGEPSV